MAKVLLREEDLLYYVVVVTYHYYNGHNNKASIINHSKSSLPVSVAQFQVTNFKVGQISKTVLAAS